MKFQTLEGVAKNRFRKVEIKFGTKRITWKITNGRRFKTVLNTYKSKYQVSSYCLLEKHTGIKTLITFDAT